MSCDQKQVEARLRDEAGRSGKVGTMVALGVWQHAMNHTSVPRCLAESSHLRLEGRLMEGQREVRRWKEQRRLMVEDDGISLEIDTTLWNELGLENSQHVLFTLRNGSYHWTTPWSEDRFDRPEVPGDRGRLLAYGHGFQSVLEDVPGCLDPIYNEVWAARLGVFEKPTVVRHSEGLVMATWLSGDRHLELRIEDLQANELPR